MVAMTASFYKKLKQACICALAAALFLPFVAAAQATSTQFFDEPLVEEDPNAIPPLQPNPYANLSPEEQAKLPLSAQLPDIKEQVSVNISPEIPKPNQKVNISVMTYGVDINSSEITWLANGKEVAKGMGKKSFDFK